MPKIKRDESKLVSGRLTEGVVVVGEERGGVFGVVSVGVVGFVVEGAPLHATNDSNIQATNIKIVIVFTFFILFLLSILYY